MSARNGEAERRHDVVRVGRGGFRRLRRVHEKRRMKVRLDVVDANQGNAHREGKPLRRVQPDRQRGGKTGTVGDGDRVDFLFRNLAELVERGADDLADFLNVRTRGNLRHDPAVGHVQGNLRVDHV